MQPASGSQTGRVTPRVTVKRTPSSSPDKASIRATPRSRSACRFAMLSACPRQTVGTQFTHCPPETTPVETVQSASDSASMARIFRAIARIAERPSWGEAPAWLGRPRASSSKRAMA